MWIGTLSIPFQNEIPKGTLRAIFVQTARVVPKGDLTHRRDDDMLHDPWSLPEERAPEKTGCHYERAYGEPNKNSGFNNLLNLLADDPVRGEPVSEARFPANREKNREKRVLGRDWLKSKSKKLDKSII